MQQEINIIDLENWILAEMQELQDAGTITGFLKEPFAGSVSSNDKPSGYPFAYVSPIEMTKTAQFENISVMETYAVEIMVKFNRSDKNNDNAPVYAVAQGITRHFTRKVTMDGLLGNVGYVRPAFTKPFRLKGDGDELVLITMIEFDVVTEYGAYPEQ